MGDIYCKVCGEPWDAYGVYHGDMTEEERDTFLKGKGCPCCKGVKPKDDEEDHTEDFMWSALDETDDPDEIPDLWLA